MACMALAKHMSETALPLLLDPDSFFFMVLVPFFPLPAFFTGFLLPLLDFEAPPTFLTGFLLPLLDFVALPTFLTGFLLLLLDLVALPTFLTAFFFPDLDFAFLAPLLLLDFTAFFGPLLFLTSPALLTSLELASSSSWKAIWVAATARTARNTRHSLLILVKML